MTRTLHLVRPGRTPGLPLAAADTVVYIEEAGYREGPPDRATLIDAHELVQRIFAADLVITW